MLEWHAQVPPPGEMVQEIQFGFEPGSTCEFNCTNNAFIRCSHCGKLMCLKHFLERSCFHDHHLTMDDDNNENGNSTESSAPHDEHHDHDELRLRKAK